MLRSVTNFDDAITRAVHTVNLSLFRVSTDPTGCFRYKVELDNNNVVRLTDYARNQTFQRSLQGGGPWTPSAQHFSPGLRAFVRAAFPYQALDGPRVSGNTPG